MNTDTVNWIAQYQNERIHIQTVDGDLINGLLVSIDIDTAMAYLEQAYTDVYILLDKIVAIHLAKPSNAYDIIEGK